MQSEFKANIDGTQAMGNRSSDVKVANPRTIRSGDFLLRIAAVVTTLVAAIVMGVAKETKLIPLLGLSVTAKWHYSSAIVFFVVVNSIACAYAAISLVLSIANRTATGGLALCLIIFDLTVTALLFSAVGAASTIGVLGYNGNSHLNWNKVCTGFDKFCHQLTASIVISLVGSVIFLLMTILSTMNLHRRSN
ncbi:CASP-like protein 1E2 [Tasmannia lanceolata]|uniref:CASP-like protein 1E2 n=1 Tax=Tasmannia lanceolata TaxID=3420 RepID=UPI0040646E71